MEGSPRAFGACSPAQFRLPSTETKINGDLITRHSIDGYKD